HFAKDHLRIRLLPKDTADWSPDLSGGKNRRCHLVKQGLKQVVIGAVNQHDFGWSPTERFGCCQSPKTSAHNYNSWQMFFTHNLASLRLVKPLVVSLDADFPRISSRNKNEISYRQGQAHRPPSRDVEESAPAGSDGVGGQ